MGFYRFFLFFILVSFSVEAAKKVRVKTGLDHLMANPDAHLKDKRIGLIVNHSAIDARGRHIIDLLHPKFKITKIFAPEHGVRGAVDEHVADGKDSKTGIPIVSLYQRKKKAPSEEDLKDVDILIFDIQEIGVRYYTYSSTMAMAMKAAKAAGKPMLILDRPNMAAPLGVYGPILESKFHGGFAGYYPIPITHAMTIGELAQYYNTNFQIGADIRVIKLSGYKHSMFFDQTGLKWVKPSPNITDMNSVIGYHLAGALETLNISVGRGTKKPFQYFGAPFFNGKKMAQALNAARLPGIKFVPVSFRPERSVYSRKRCSGFRLVITDRRKIQPLRTLVTIAQVLYKNLPEATRDKNWARTANGIGETGFIERIAKGESYKALEQLIAADVQAFSEQRKRHLMYP